jgi:hypothetical protein
MPASLHARNGVQRRDQPVSIGLDEAHLEGLAKSIGLAVNSTADQCIGVRRAFRSGEFDPKVRHLEFRGTELASRGQGRFDQVAPAIDHGHVASDGFQVEAGVRRKEVRQPIGVGELGKAALVRSKASGRGELVQEFANPALIIRQEPEPDPNGQDQEDGAEKQLSQKSTFPRMSRSSTGPDTVLSRLSPITKYSSGSKIMAGLLLGCLLILA